MLCAYDGEYTASSYFEISKCEILESTGNALGNHAMEWDSFSKHYSNDVVPFTQVSF
jgi:hypothetical protein